MNTPKKRLLFVNGHMKVGGGEKSLLDLLTHLNYTLCDVDLLLTEGKGEYFSMVPPQVNIIFVDTTKAYGALLPTIKSCMENRYFYAIWFRIVLLLTRFFSKKALCLLSPILHLRSRYDCAIAYRTGPCADLVAYAVSAKKKICWWHHGECLYSQAQVKNTNSVWKSFDNIVAVSHGCKNMIESIFDYPSDQIVVIPNLIDIDKITLLAGEKSPYEENTDVIKIITVGRLSPEKHLQDIPQIATELIKNGMHQFKWYIVGEGDMREHIEQEIRKYNVGNHVCLLGSKSNPYPFIKFADMMVHTSHIESQGLTILEAMALRTPCVAVASMGPKEYMNVSNGYLVNKDVSLIAETILRAMKDLPNEKMVDNAYKTVKDTYSPKSVICRLYDIV